MPRAPGSVIKPRYETERVKLYFGRCEEVLPTLGGIHAVVTDPPYGIAYSPGTCTTGLAGPSAFANRVIIGDDEPFDPSHLLKFPVVCLWGANHYAHRLPPRAKWLAWDKRNGLPSNDQSDCELAWTNQTSPARLFVHRWMGMIKDSEKDQVRLHQTQKPVELMKWCLKTLGVPLGGVVFDGYMGSGTTGVACQNLGMHFVGVECDPAYYAIAERRIREAECGPDRLEPPRRVRTN